MPRQEIKPKRPLEIGGLVRFYRKGWRFGRLVKIVDGWGRVLHLGRIRSIRIEEIEPYV